MGLRVSFLPQELSRPKNTREADLKLLNSLFSFYSNGLRGVILCQGHE